jgi:hypothetical protein
MKSLIATRPRRVAIAFSTWLITTVLMASLMAHVEQPDPAHLEMGDWMKRFVIVPGLAALMVFLFTTAVMRPVQAAPALKPAEPEIEELAKPFVAQVVGLMWLNPLQRMDYPTEWQLLWTQGLSTPNKNDDMVRTKPEKFSSLRSIGALVYGNRGTETFKGFYHKYVSKFLVLMRSRYFSNASYFYTVKYISSSRCLQGSIRSKRRRTSPMSFSNASKSAHHHPRRSGAATRPPISRSRKATQTPALHR